MLPEQLIPVLTTAAIPELRMPEFFEQWKASLTSAGHEPEELEIESDGAGDAPGTMRGWLFRGEPGRPLVILGHGVHACRVDMAMPAAGLAMEGINAVAMDWRGHGLSDGRVITFGYHEKHDLLKLALEVQEMTQAGPIIVGGLSMGGAISTMASGDPTIAGVIAMSAYYNFRDCFERFLVLSFPGLTKEVAAMTIDMLEKDGKLPLEEVDPSKVVAAQEKFPPLLSLHGAHDEVVSTDHPEALRHAWKGECDYHLFPNAGHADILNERDLPGKIHNFIDKIEKA